MVKLINPIHSSAGFKPSSLMVFPRKMENCTISGGSGSQWQPSRGGSLTSSEVNHYPKSYFRLFRSQIRFLSGKKRNSSLGERHSHTDGIRRQRSHSRKPAWYSYHHRAPRPSRFGAGPFRSKGLQVGRSLHCYFPPTHTLGVELRSLGLPLNPIPYIPYYNPYPPVGYA